MANVLRGEWKFDGLVSSDYYGINELVARHHVAEDKKEAARQALKAGVDMELPDPDSYKNLPDLIKEGKIHRSGIRHSSFACVYVPNFYLVYLKNLMLMLNALFKLPTAPNIQKLAAEAARRSITLLKNDGNLLPLDRNKIKSIAVIGPNAAKVHFGGYTDPTPPKGVSVLEGIQNKVGDKIKVNYAEGCKITVEGGNWWADKSTLPNPQDDAKLISKAIKTAKNSDIAIVVIGSNEDTNKEGWAEGHLGDRDNIDLIGQQNNLVKAVLETGKPTIVLLINSGPIAIPYIAENVPANSRRFLSWTRNWNGCR